MTVNVTRPSLDQLIQLSASARLLPLRARQVIARFGEGHLSPFRGRGMEYDESRPYQPGDDVRNIDWRVTARTQTTYTKVFREERERPVQVVVDLSTSMQFATRTRYKSVMACQLAALLGFSVAQAGDRFGLELMSHNQPRMTQSLRPVLGQQAALRACHAMVNSELWTADSEAGTFDNSSTPLSLQPINEIVQVTKPGSLLFILSDFNVFFSRPDYETALIQLSRHADVCLIHVTDIIEREMPRPGHYLVMQQGQLTPIVTYGRQQRKAYAAAFQQRQQRLTRLCQQYRMHYIHCDTGDAVLHSLQQGFNLVPADEPTSAAAS